HSTLAGRVEAGDRLLRVAGVARAEHEVLLAHPARQPVLAHGRERQLEPLAEGCSRQIGADRRAAHPADDQPARRLRLQARGLDPPERVAQMVGQGEDVVELVGSVDRPDGIERAHVYTPPGSTRASASSTVPGSMRAFSPITLPGAITAPAPTSTPAARI